MPASQGTPCSFYHFHLAFYVFWTMRELVSVKDGSNGDWVEWGGVALVACFGVPCAGSMIAVKSWGSGGGCLYIEVLVI